MRAATFLLVFALLPRLVVAQGSPLGPEFRVNTYTMDGQAEPSVAADSAGNFVVVWQSANLSHDSENVIFGQRFASSGEALGPEFEVNEPFLDHFVPSVAADDAGNFIVVWTIQFFTGYGLRGRRFASSGVPLGGQFEVGTGGYNGSASVAADSAGNFVVVWTKEEGSTYSVFGQRYASSGAPLGAPFRVNTYTMVVQGSPPSVTADPSGKFVVVWQSTTQGGPGEGVFGRRYASSGAALGGEFRVNTYTLGSQGRPSVAADAAGNFVVVWQSLTQDGSSEGIFGQRFASSGAPIGPEFRVNTYTTSDQLRPSAAADGAGNFVVLWQSLSQDGSGLGVFGQRYAGSGVPLGPEFVVNTYTMAAQAVPSVAADSFGNFVVAWQSLNQDGSGYGVFGQRYQPILPVELMRFGVE